MAFNFKQSNTIKTKMENDTKVKNDTIVFDPIKHVYYYKGDPLLSVTQFIHKHVVEFNPLFPSISKSKKNIKDKNGITNPALLRKYWKLNSERSSALGTATHVFTEMYMLDRTTEPKSGYEEAALKAIHEIEKEWTIESQEDILYSTKYMIAGSRDLKLRHKKTGEVWVGDWKTTTDMTKYYDYLLYPFNELKGSSLNKYSIQLDMYSLLDNKEYIPESNRLVIQLKPDGTFQFYYPEHEDDRYKLPYTLRETKKAISIYIENNKQ